MQYKILVVVGKPIFLDLIKIVLQANGFTVKGTPNCTIALELTERWKPNLIILDSNIARRKVLHFTEAIQKLYSIPILILTSTDSNLNTLEWLNAGASDCITKPVSFSELLAKVHAFEHGFSLTSSQYQLVPSIPTNAIIEECRDITSATLGDFIPSSLR